MDENYIIFYYINWAQRIFLSLKCPIAKPNSEHNKVRRQPGRRTTEPVGPGRRCGRGGCSQPGVLGGGDLHWNRSMLLPGLHRHVEPQPTLAALRPAAREVPDPLLLEGDPIDAVRVHSDGVGYIARLVFLLAAQLHDALPGRGVGEPWIYY